MKRLIPCMLITFSYAFFSVNAAALINVDLGNSTAVGVSDIAGVVASSGWYQESASPDFSNRALDLSDGSASGALLTADGTGNYTAIGAATTDPNYTMYNRVLGIEGNSGLSTLNVTGLSSAFTAAGYDVYVYFSTLSNSSGSNVRDTLSFSDGTTTFYSDVDENNANYQGSFVQAATTSYSSGNTPIANYVKFSGLTSTDFTISARNVDNVTGATAGFAGMQIVAIPEPSSVMLLSLALMGLLPLVRRREP